MISFRDWVDLRKVKNNSLRGRVGGVPLVPESIISIYQSSLNNDDNIPLEPLALPFLKLSVKNVLQTHQTPNIICFQSFPKLLNKSVVLRRSDLGFPTRKPCPNLGSGTPSLRLGTPSLCLGTPSLGLGSPSRSDHGPSYWNLNVLGGA